MENFINGSKEFKENVDIPEAGLDAIAKAMSCHEIIGWQEERTKTIVFISDEEMHFALDGLLGGITENFAEDQCRLNKFEHLGKKSHYYGYDSDQDRFDYPSLGQVSVMVCCK